MGKQQQAPGAAGPPASGRVKREVYELSQAAVDCLGNPGLHLELHSINFSHYCARAAWALRLLSLDFTEVEYLPMAHVAPMISLVRKFKVHRAASTASSNSPAVTPALAVYAPDGSPICLLQNSSLISRWAALHCRALGRPGWQVLYGPSLTLRCLNAGGNDAAPATASQGGASAGTDAAARAVNSRTSSWAVEGSGAHYEAVAALELRLSGAIGVEVRRVIYFNTLPTAVGARLFVANAPHPGRLAALTAWLTWLICRATLPRLLGINARSAAAGVDRLRSEFDFLDELLATPPDQRHALATGRSSSSSGAGGGSGERGRSCDGAPGCDYLLPGPGPTAADVSLATLAGYIVGVTPATLTGRWGPAVEEMPADLAALVRELAARPTGRFTQQLCDRHGCKRAGSGGGVTSNRSAL